MLQNLTSKQKQRPKKFVSIGQTVPVIFLRNLTMSGVVIKNKIKIKDSKRILKMWLTEVLDFIQISLTSARSIDQPDQPLFSTIK